MAIFLCHLALHRDNHAPVTNLLRFQVVRNLKTIPRWSHIPVLLLACVACAQNADLAVDSGPTTDGDVTAAADARNRTDASTVPLPSPVTLQWWDEIGGAGREKGADVAVDEAGNIYFLSNFTESVKVGEGTVVSGGASDVLVIKYLPDGNLGWYRHYTGTESQYGFALALDQDEELLVTFAYSGAIQVGSITLSNQGERDIALLKLTSSGDLVWARSYGSGSGEFALAMAAKAGRIALTGHYNRQGPDFGGGALPASDSESPHTSPFVAVLDDDGNHVWSRGYVTEGIAEGLGVAFDPIGNVLLSGSFSDSIDFGEGLLEAYNSDMFINKYSTTGDLLWSQVFGGSSHDSAHGIVANAVGEVYVGARFHDSVDFGGHVLQTVDGVTSANADAVLLKLSQAGKVLWAKHVGSQGDESIDDVALDNAGRPLVVGDFRGALDLGDGPMDGTDTDILLARFDQDGTPLFSSRIPGDDLTLGHAIAVNAAGTVAVAGRARGPLLLLDQETVYSEGWDSFVLCFSPESD